MAGDITARDLHGLIRFRRSELTSELHLTLAHQPFALPKSIMYNLLALLLAAGLSLASKDHATFRVEDLLAAPRAQAPIPNPAGDLVLAVIDRWNATADT